MNRIILTIAAALIATGHAYATDLATYKATYEKEMEAIVLEHAMQMTNLGQQYTKALDELLTKVKRAGDLNKTTAVMDEIKRFTDEKKMPEKPASLLDIQNLQAYFAKQASFYEANKAKKIISLTTKYDQALERLEKSLVRSDKLDEAKAVQEERKRTTKSEEYAASIASLETNTKPSNTPEIAPKTEKHERVSLADISRLKRECILYYSFDKNEKEKVSDVSKKKNHANIRGATYITKGKNNSGYKFDGIDDYMISEDNIDISKNHSFSITTWVKPGFSENKMSIVSLGAANHFKGGTGIAIDKENYPIFELSGVGSVRAEKPITDDEWTFVAIVNNNGLFQVFVNGLPSGRSEDRAPALQNGEVMIGRYTKACEDFFSGEIDDIMIYDKALSGKEIEQIYNYQK